MKMTKATARKVRTALDWSMTVMVVLLGGFLFTVFALTMVKLFVGAWSIGLGFIPITVAILVVIVLTWHILDKKVYDTLGEDEGEDDQASTTL